MPVLEERARSVRLFARFEPLSRPSFATSDPPVASPQAQAYGYGGEAARRAFPGVPGARVDVRDADLELDARARRRDASNRFARGESFPAESSFVPPADAELKTGLPETAPVNLQAQFGDKHLLLGPDQGGRAGCCLAADMLEGHLLYDQRVYGGVFFESMTKNFVSS